jgi:hypothetical protein
MVFGSQLNQTQWGSGNFECCSFTRFYAYRAGGCVFASIERDWEAESLRRDSAQQWNVAPLYEIPLNTELYLHSAVTSHDGIICS